VDDVARAHGLPPALDLLDLRALRQKHPHQLGFALHGMVTKLKIEVSLSKD